MGRVLGILVVVVIAVAALGFYLGWFQISTTKSPDNKSTISVTVDKEKIKQDEQRAKEKLLEEEQKAAEELRKLKKD